MTLRQEACYGALAEDLRNLARGRKIVEIVNSGNWGDALIHAGQAEFLRDIGIQVRQIPVRKLSRYDRTFALREKLQAFGRPRAAIITGNGAFSGFYKRPEEFRVAASHFDNVLLMPASYTVEPPFDGDKFQFWRRDAVESLETRPDAKFCHDMAFYLKPKPRPIRRSVGVLFRTDLESADFRLPKNNRDISNEGKHTTDPEAFLDAVGEYEVIHTNRLHVGIAGVLMGREVHLYGGNIAKVWSIYKTSIEPFYQNVTFHHDAPDADALDEMACEAVM